MQQAVFSTGGAIPGLEPDTTYYVIVVDLQTIKLARTSDDAKSGTAITFAPLPTLTAAGLTRPLPITKISESTGTLQYDFDTGLRTGDLVTYHAVPGQAIGGLSDNTTYRVVAGGDPNNPNAPKKPAGHGGH